MSIRGMFKSANYGNCEGAEQLPTMYEKEIKVMAEMVKDPNCAYCMQGELVAKFGYPVCEMKTGFLYVFKEQSKKGRVILAHKKHVSELIDLTG